MSRLQHVLVTGANKGIGLATVKKILQQSANWVVFLGSRNRSRGESAKQQLIDENPSFSERIIVLELDVTSEDSVQQATQTVKETLQADTLYGIVNNAGIAGAPLQQTLAVNVYGVQRVCAAFVPLLHPTDGRIVMVSSAAGPSFVATCQPDYQAFLTNGNADWKAIDTFMQECLSITGGSKEFASRGLGNGSAYHLSKACLNAYTIHLAKAYPTLHVNACTPGFIETDLTRPMAKLSNKSPQEMGMKPPEEGTKSVLYLLFDQLQGNGRYYGSDAVRSPLDRYRSPGDPAYSGS